MKRASLIVVVKYPNPSLQEVGHTCESLHVNIDGTVTFFCSGTPQTVHQDWVVRIDYNARGAEFCPHCDTSLTNVFYGDQRKNP